ncbi:MAG: ATP-binding cassette domain-containing protein [Acidimicrobiia bacterium]|nr:ATP-binding cassette domain-containing protein [Acidimicrobiia bacterium]MYB25366.1 ATP-binding cassette domain-containing protein [Acidimicrobiia bacterium]
MIELAGWGISQQDLLTGGVTGLTYAALAAGFVLVYRASGILNFAHAEVGALCAASFVLLLTGHGLAWWLAFAAAIAGGFLVGSAVELTIIRRLAQSSRLVLLIATIGVGQLLVLAKINLPAVLRPGPIPPPFELRWQVTDDLRILSRELVVIVAVPLLIGGLGLVLHRTRFGLAARAAAANPDTARAYGIRTRRISTALWGIAGSLSAATAVFFAPLEGVSAAQTGSVALAPPLLLRALVVSLIARMRSLPLTLVGGVAVGIGEKIVRDNVASADRSIVDLFLFAAVVVSVLFAARARRDEAGWSLSPKLRAVPRQFADLAIVRHLGAVGLGGIFVFFGLLGWLVDSPTSLWLWTGILIHTMVALSLTLLTGWAGQISLGQFAFVGLGAFCLVALTKGHDIPIPFDAFDLSLRLNWGTAVVLCTLIGALAALTVGVPALAVRGLFLAVATLAFAVASANWILAQDVFTGGTTSVRPVEEPVLGPFDFGASRKSFYFLCLGFLIFVTVLLARLRRTGIGRSLLAVRENEEMAAASTVSVARMKITAFAVAGGVAALAGALYGTLQENLSPANTFAPDFSIDVVAISVIGGLGSIAGPFLGVLWVKGIPALFDPTAPPEWIRLATSGIGLLVLLLYLPGGLVQLLYDGRDAALKLLSRSRWGARGAPERRPVSAAALAPPPRPAVPDSPVWLRTQALSVSFGGNAAVREVDFEVRRGELVGLIGTNGAGKSTLMNAVSGFVAASGTVELLGRDVSGLRAHERHRRGLGRCFQSARLYPDLTVAETLMVALEARRRSLLVPSLLGVAPSPGAERQKRAEAAEVLDYLGIGDLAGSFVSELSTGARRVVELGCMLAGGARVLMLDEPASGLSQRESEGFGPRIKEVQAELGAAVVVIEHNVPLVMGISDRMYCLEAGSVISEGTPAQLRADPAVIASYLGSTHQPPGRLGD